MTCPNRAVVLDRWSFLTLFIPTCCFFLHSATNCFLSSKWARWNDLRNSKMADIFSFWVYVLVGSVFSVSNRLILYDTSSKGSVNNNNREQGTKKREIIMIMTGDEWWSWQETGWIQKIKWLDEGKREEEIMGEGMKTKNEWMKKMTEGWWWRKWCDDGDENDDGMTMLTQMTLRRLCKLQEGMMKMMKRWRERKWRKLQDRMLTKRCDEG